MYVSFILCLLSLPVCPEINLNRLNTNKPLLGLKLISEVLRSIMLCKYL